MPHPSFWSPEVSVEGRDGVYEIHGVCRHNVHLVSFTRRSRFETIGMAPVPKTKASAPTAFIIKEWRKFRRLTQER